MHTVAYGAIHMLRHASLVSAQRGFLGILGHTTSPDKTNFKNNENDLLPGGYAPPRTSPRQPLRGYVDGRGRMDVRTDGCRRTDGRTRTDGGGRTDADGRGRVGADGRTDGRGQTDVDGRVRPSKIDSGRLPVKTKLSPDGRPSRKRLASDGCPSNKNIVKF